MSFFKKLFGQREPNPALEEISLEFAELLDNSRAYLNSYTELNRSGWNLGKQKSYEINQDEGLLRFNFEDGTVVECPFQAIGSFSTDDNTWAWAWANPSVNENLKVDALRTCEYGRQHQIPQLTTPQWPADMEWAWSMTAFAASGSHAEGAFCAATGPMRIFLTFRDVKIIPPEPAMNA